MSWGAGSKAWFIAASVGAVEGLKDQGFCRWSHAIRSLDQRAKNNLRSILRPEPFLFFFDCS
ncbi:2-nonaprenyl-3-methyl-6-methoxy-1,4-benzoquinol hydroxylase [Hibiscus syriacus]|uniref:2-nonaprenyl-3-methyl-6-methoxy-1,4-benzoquinol hydroxylase n=1 Tax=Hibiscus syriacus TaxID=106335 RepID=A0A6A2XLP4_HIBSY|nr:2-nonaprenyl-3-methyl-6-methoxy-1,4-benzoquinol hydroxylase [Hibiscus syriacus]